MKLQSCSCCCAFVCCNLIFIFLQVPFIVRDGEVSVVRERESKTCSLLQAACSAFCRVTVTAVPNFSVLCTICQSRVLSPLTSNQFEFQLMRDQNQLLCLDLQNFKSLESGDVHQNFCLQKLQHLISGQTFGVFRS